MTALSRSESKNMYSWWWDSHISPKNSKWLKENLTDMDSNVKSMIKIIEVDEDTFARRAEMYYKKRPELMKLVEEFYRAYRALAERYDHATGVIRQAHKTMAEAFPNQVPFLMTEDGPMNPADDSDPRTPEMQAPVRAGSDLDELRKGAVGLSSSDFLSGKPGANFTNGSSKKEFKQLNGVGKARKGLNFQGVEEKGDVLPQVLSESERLGRSEGDIQGLKDSLAKLETEKESGLLEYRKTLERLTKLESDFSQAKEDSQGLNLRANKAEAEVQSLKELLANVEVEREASLTQYRQSLDKIANLERHVSQAEDDVGHLNDELSRVKAEKEALLAKYMEALEKLANLENKLLLAEDYASRTMERAENAEREVNTMKETIERLTEEKEAAVLKYEQSLEKIATLEREIIVIQEETERLKAEVQDGVAKIKQSEETCLLLDRSNKSLQSEVDSLGQKVSTQNQELSEKQRELGRLWTCVQEERMRFMETEAGFQSLQNLHSKVQEDLRSVANELQKKVQLLKELENQKKQLEDEVQKVKDENKSLDDLNSLSAISMKNMQEEIIGLKSGKEKLEEELLDQRNALQLEISSLKAELHSLSQKHQDLQDENSKLNENCQRSTTEISSLVEKLGVMERLVKKNEVLENSMSDLSAELEGARGKVEELEESCKLLMGEKFTLGTEKGTLISQLVMTTENLEKLSQRNTLLENTLFDVNAELEMLRLKSRNLEDSCMLLSDRNRILVSEKEMLTCELDLTHKRLEDLGQRHEDLEKRYSTLEEERKSTLERVKELQIYLASEKHEHTNLENHIRQIQEEGDHLREEFDQELDNAVNAQFEIFLLYKSIQDLKDGNISLLGFCEKLVEASRLSAKLISELEKESSDHQDNVKMLRMGMFQLLDTLEADIEPSSDDCSNEDRRLIYLIQEKLYDIKSSLCEAWDEKQELVVQKSVLVEVIRQLKQDVSDLNSVVHAFKKELESKNTEVLSQQKETQKLLENNEELILKVREGNMKEALLLAEVENLREKLLTLQKDYDDLQNENSRVVEGNKSLIFTIKDLEDEYSCMVGEVVELDHLTVILKNVISEKSNKVTELTETIEKICSDHGILEEKVRSIERNLNDARTKNTVFELSLKKSENELEEVRVTNDQLMGEIVNGKDLLCMKEMELLEMQKEQKETEAKVRALNSELQKGKDEVKLWETIAGSFFTELQGCSVREALIKEKFAELVKAYEALEDESYSKCMDIAQLRERVGALEGENSEIKGRLVADLSAIMSLKDSVASLEKHTISFKNIHQVDNGKKEDLEGSQDSNECQSDGSVSLDKVQTKIQYVEKAIIELKQHAQEEYSGVRSDLDLALRQIEGLKSQNSSRRGSSGRLSRRVPSQPGDDPRNGPVDGFKQRSGPDTFEPEEVLMMKDIVLDQASDCSSYGRNRKVMKSNDHVLELWETVDHSGSIDLTVGKPNKYFVLDAVKENKSGRPSSVSVVERELGVDDQLSSRRFRDSQVEDTKRKTLERLASDVQKLTNLQITVRDLKDKLEMSENTSTKGKATECDGVKEQLEESEQMILKLFDYSAKVMKNIENSTSASSSMSFDGSSSIADSSDGSGRRKKSMDQARRISEKIGRLQLEIQKIQFLLMKLDNNKAGKGGARIVERNTRVLLRDYLYGGTRTPRRRKKTHFCGCVQPATRGSD
ncbi:protein NETWORKED 1D [Silene latifolia]|uniref:protein NETWORKED 1D n=1 Tax=Silene latifolia TaxID=37657 RepID=UPI003D781952